MLSYLILLKAKRYSPSIIDHVIHESIFQVRRSRYQILPNHFHSIRGKAQFLNSDYLSTRLSRNSTESIDLNLFRSIESDRDFDNHSSRIESRVVFNLVWFMFCRSTLSKETNYSNQTSKYLCLHSLKYFDLFSSAKTSSLPRHANEIVSNNNEIPPDKSSSTFRHKPGCPKYLPSSEYNLLSSDLFTHTTIDNIKKMYRFRRNFHWTLNISFRILPDIPEPTDLFDDQTYIHFYIPSKSENISIKKPWKIKYYSACSFFFSLLIKWKT